MVSFDTHAARVKAEQSERAPKGQTAECEGREGFMELAVGHQEDGCSMLRHIQFSDSH